MMAHTDELTWSVGPDLGRCGGPDDPTAGITQRLPGSGDAEPAPELAFCGMLAGDAILIDTENSNYSFSILSPAEHRGILAGGSIGTCVVDAVLVAEPVGRDGRVGTRCSKLRTGSRIVCLIASGKSFTHLITSRVTRLARVRTSQPAKLSLLRNG